MTAETRAQDEIAAQPSWLARLAHDLRDPITPLRFAVQQLRAGQGSAEEQASLLRLMDRQIDAVLVMADEVADLVRIERGDFRLHLGPAGLNDIVSVAVRALARGAAPANATVNVLEDTCELMVVNADDARLSQLIVHILRLIGAGGQDDSLTEIHCAANDSRVQLTIRNDDKPIHHSARLEYLISGQSPSDARGLVMANLIAREILLKHDAKLSAVEATAKSMQALILEIPRAKLPEFIAFEP